MRATCALLGSIPGNSSIPFTAGSLLLCFLGRYPPHTQKSPEVTSPRMAPRGIPPGRLLSPKIERASLHHRGKVVSRRVIEDQSGPLRVLRVPNRDGTRQVASNLDTVVVGAAPRALAPCRPGKIQRHFLLHSSFPELLCPRPQALPQCIGSHYCPLVLRGGGPRRNCSPDILVSPQLLSLFKGKCAHDILNIDDTLVRRVEKSKHGKRPNHGRVLTSTERQNLNDNVRSVAFPHEVLDLCPHNFGCTHSPYQNSLIQHNIYFRRRWIDTCEHLLALQPHLYPPVDLFGGIRRPASPDDGTGIVRRLK